LFIVSDSPHTAKMIMEEISATKKKVMVAVIVDSRYFETALFMGKYMESIAPINKDAKMKIVFCMQPRII